jgi:hypothetical protein
MTIEEEKQEESLTPAVTSPIETARHGDVKPPLDATVDANVDVDAVPEVETVYVDVAFKEEAETTDKDDVESNEEPEEGKKKKMKMVAADAPWKDRMWEVFTTFWPLGLIAFGGPQAHVAILRDHLVEQRDWLDEEQFTELFAIGQVRIYTDSIFDTMRVASLHYISWS